MPSLPLHNRLTSRQNRLNMSPSPPLNGRLHIYSEAKNLVCFESGDAAANNVLAFYGGFNAGLYSMPVLADLSGSLPPDWSLVQALSRSSYQGVLTAKQTETAEDMHDLEVYLRQTQHKTGPAKVRKSWKPIYTVVCSSSLTTLCCRLQRRNRLL